MGQSDIFGEKVASCTLNRIFGFDPGAGRRIIESAGSAMAVFEMDDDGLDALMGPFNRFRNQLTMTELDRSASELISLESGGYDFISITDDRYPDLLRDCRDAPIGLYIRSGTEPERIFDDSPSISIVGTRDMSPYGKEWCQRIVDALSRCQRKPAIVSGLALGIDITAHMAALDAGMQTIAVLPTHITDVYPHQHRRAASRIAGTEGCALISDYPPGTSPQAVNFLRRNRIIAGMSQATILVESKAKGGGLITANLAFDYCREVYALPGRVDDPRSQGCNRLIRAKVAEPIDDLEAFVKSLGLGAYTRRSKAILKEEIEQQYGTRLENAELRLIHDIAALIKCHRGISTEELCGITGCSWAEASRITGLLEADGFIDRDIFQHCSMKFRF